MLTGVWKMQRMAQLKVVSLMIEAGSGCADEVKAQDVPCYTLKHFETLDFARY